MGGWVSGWMDGCYPSVFNDVNEYLAVYSGNISEQ